MKKDKDIWQRIYRLRGIIIWLTITVVSAILISIIGYSTWYNYKERIIEKQKEQMLIIAKSLAENFEETINNYESDLEHLETVIVFEKGEDHAPAVQKAVCSSYIENDQGYVDNLILRNEKDEIIWQAKETQTLEVYDRTALDSGIFLQEIKGIDGEIYFVLEKKIAGIGRLELYMDVDQYYQKLIADIKLGTNGYVMVKNSDGIIFMHPTKEQLGVNVIDGRMEIYPDIDLTSLNQMVEHQNTEQEGVSEYYSYWWSDENLPRVKKISAFSHAKIGTDFLIVSAVMDYDDIYIPIQQSFRAIFFTFGLILIIFAIYAAAFAYLTTQKQKNTKEISYLKDLNQVLEETRRSEEVIAHQQRLQIMGTMTGGIAHEFNNLLTPIMGYADMLMGVLPEESEEFDYAQEIFNASDKAKDIIRQIAGLSRKNMETVFSFIPLQSTLKRTLKMVKSVCPANIQLVVSDQTVEAGFLGNETQLNQVILNICMNAFHAIGKEKMGLVQINTFLANRSQIEERHQIKLDLVWEDYICIQISDNGSGMEKETLEQIFNPFFTTKVGGQGTGLGLSVAEQIIHSHKGQILVESLVGEGTSFYIYLPKSEANKHFEDSLQTGEENKFQMLVIDDNGKILKLLERKFKKIGIQIDAADNTEEAKVALEKKAYQVLLVDQELSRTGNDDSGLYFAIAMNQKYPNMIKIVTVDQIRKEVIEAKQHGYIDAYLEKPISDEQLLETIHQIYK